MDVKGVVVQVLESGTDFGAYRIEGLLGRGGMSEVYRASNPRLGNTIAVKLLTRELANDEIFRERFVRESRLAASLNHPNVIPIFDAGESDGMPYIAMRYVEGSDLEQLLEREGPLSAAATASIVSQIAAALDCAHSQGLIHRDVKPANILLEGNGDASHVYLSDFGVAKHGGSRSGLTSTGHFVGTVDYIAPEQIEGKPVSGATDVYSLGCVLYQCLTAEPPFDRDSDVAMIYAHLVEPPPLVSERRPDLPAGLDAVVSKALSKRPEDRYGTCRELVAALRAAAGLETAQTLGGAATADDTATRLADQPARLPVPETILAADSTMPRPHAAPPTELASSLTAPSPSAGPELAAAPPAPLTELSAARSERKTVSMRRLWRSKRLLIAAAVALLLAAGAAAAAQTLGGGSSKKHGGAGSNQAGSANNGSDIAGDGVAVNADGKSKGGKTTTQKSKKQSSSTGKKKTKKASSTNSALSSRRSSSSKSGSTGSTLNSRRSSSGTSSSGSSSKSTSSTLSSRRSGSSSSSSSGSTSGTLSSRRNGK
jgi:serine/threonine-protein kinase